MIHWNPDVVAFSLGSYGVRWYSLCWCIGLLSVYLLEQRLYKEQKIEDEKFEPLFLYCFLGILIGARLGHCIFYQPDIYLTSLKGVLSMVLPVHFAPNSWDWQYTGFEGLASHGGTLGLMLALWLFVRKTGLNLMRVLDNIAIVTPICACAIRMGNLMNSEIIGKQTDLPWAFVFERVDMVPRHPGQLYEAIAYALFFVVGWVIYRRGLRTTDNGQQSTGRGLLSPKHVGTGFFFGLCIFLIFSARILIEYTKEAQVAFEQDMIFNMGQLLSIPFVILGLYCMLGGKYCRMLGEKN